ncbi:MAG TPA: hypothetical protein VF746_04990 [Longimicrobium sp.]|jgi:hypothetical protein
MKYDPRELSGSGYDFPYVELPGRLQERALSMHAWNLRRRFTGLARDWGPERNAEWMVRSYCAAKLMLAATAALSGARAARRGRRGRRAELTYEGLIAAARALLAVAPELGWDDGGLFTLSHERAVGCLVRVVGGVDRSQAVRMRDLLDSARAHLEQGTSREAARRAAEERGGAARVRVDVAVMAARFLCELAQFHSEVLANVLGKLVQPPVGYDLGILAAPAALATPEGVPVVDDADARRIGALMGATAMPESLLVLAREIDLVADHGAALEGEARGGDDTDWGLIFPFTA